MPPRKLRRPLEELAARAIARMSPGTLAGRVESASPARRLWDPRMSQARGPGCPCPVSIRTCTPSGPSGETGEGVYRDAVLALNPVGYWRLGETSGTNANDESANNNDGTYSGTYSQGEAAAISDDSDLSTRFATPGQTSTPTKVQIPRIAAYEIVDSLSFALWIKPTSNSIGSLRSPIAYNQTDQDPWPWSFGFSGSGGFPDAYSFYTAHGGTRHTMRSDLQSTPAESGSGYAFTLDDWHFVVCTFDGTTKKMYANGCLVSYIDPGLGDITGYNSSNTLKLGMFYGHDGSWNWPGYIDEVAVFDTVLSDSQVGNLFGIGTSFLGDGCFSEPSPCSLQPSDGVLLIDASAGDASISLPPALFAHNHIYYVKKIDSTASIVTLVPDGSDQIDGMDTYQLVDPMDAVGFISDAGAWWTVADKLQVGS